MFSKEVIKFDLDDIANTFIDFAKRQDFSFWQEKK